MKHNLNPNSSAQAGGLESHGQIHRHDAARSGVDGVWPAVSGEWLAAALLASPWKNRAKLGIDSMSVWSENQSSLGES